jgi:hypothetical protein
MNIYPLKTKSIFKDYLRLFRERNIPKEWQFLYLFLIEVNTHIVYYCKYNSVSSGKILNLTIKLIKKNCWESAQMEFSMEGRVFSIIQNRPSSKKSQLIIFIFLSSVTVF